MQDEFGSTYEAVWADELIPGLADLQTPLARLMIQGIRAKKNMNT